MFGKKVKSIGKTKKEQVKRYENTVNGAVKNYISLINSETTKRGKTFYEGQLEGYLNAVRMTEEYKAKPKRYEKIISEALKTTIPRTVPKAKNNKEF